MTVRAQSVQGQKPGDAGENGGAQTKNPQGLEGLRVFDETLAEWTGLEPATPGVTGPNINEALTPCLQGIAKL